MSIRDTTQFYADLQSRVAAPHLELALSRGGSRIHDAAAATGDYVQALLAKGRSVTGSDLNEAYVGIAQKRGLPVEVADARSLTLADDSVDSVLLYEVLEHVADAGVRQEILREARRVARGTVLITVPNCSQLALLAHAGLTYEHMLDRDHKVFFTREVLSAELATVFDQVEIQEENLLNARALTVLLRGTARPLMRDRVMPRLRRHAIYSHFFVVAQA